MGYEGWEEQAAPNIWGRQHHWRGRQHSDCLDVNEQISKSGVGRLSQDKSDHVLYPASRRQRQKDLCESELVWST